MGEVSPVKLSRRGSADMAAAMRMLHELGQAAGVIAKQLIRLQMAMIANGVKQLFRHWCRG